MTYCTKCGKKIDDEAQYCIHCGTTIKTSDTPQKEIKDKKSIEQQIEETAEGVGKKAEEIGKRIERKATDVGTHISHWYDSTFKITGPLIGAIIALIILRIIIFIIQAPGGDIFIITALSQGLHEYLPIIFASMLLSGYNTYIYRKYKHQYQWMYPLISALGFIIGAWIAAKIMLIISQSNNTPIIEAIGFFIDTYLIGIFILALIIAYAAEFAVKPVMSQQEKSHIESKQCPNCQMDIKSDAKFCSKCGKQV